jgi:hypothetical protein
MPADIILNENTIDFIGQMVVKKNTRSPTGSTNISWDKILIAKNVSNTSYFTTQGPALLSMVKKDANSNSSIYLKPDADCRMQVKSMTIATKSGAKLIIKQNGTKDVVKIEANGKTYDLLALLESVKEMNRKQQEMNRKQQEMERKQQQLEALINTQQQTQDDLVSRLGELNPDLVITLGPRTIPSRP